jgi:electron transfer flavoprotein alpha subunit
MKQLLVIAEIFEDRIRPVTWELVAAADEIKTLLFQKQTPSAIGIIVPSHDPKPLAQALSTQSGINVIGLENPGLKSYTSEIYIACLGQLIRKMNPSHILAAHTAQGCDFAPGLALALEAAAIPGVNGIESGKNGLVYSRPVFDHTRNMRVRPEPARPVVLTVMPGVFKADRHPAGTPGRIDIQKIYVDGSSGDNNRIRHRHILKRPCENQALKTAKVIVAAGRGLGEKERLDLVLRFAKCFSSSAVGASRPLVDMGWIGYEHQVGITGTRVSPQLYIACGISGSSQHIAGMKDSTVVIGINNNPAAPIFRHSDLCITEDVVEFIQAFLKKAHAGPSPVSDSNGL